MVPYIAGREGGEPGAAGYGRSLCSWWGGDPRRRAAYDAETCALSLLRSSGGVARGAQALYKRPSDAALAARQLVARKPSSSEPARRCCAQASCVPEQPASKLRARAARKQAACRSCIARARSCSCRFPQTELLPATHRVGACHAREYQLMTLGDSME